MWGGEQEGPRGKNRKQRQKEKSAAPAGVHEARLDLYSPCFITDRLELTGILTISLLSSV